MIVGAYAIGACRGSFSIVVVLPPVIDALDAPEVEDALPPVAFEFPPVALLDDAELLLLEDVLDEALDELDVAPEVLGAGVGVDVGVGIGIGRLHCGACARQQRDRIRTTKNCFILSPENRASG